jgi:hypothetical protein
MMTDSTYSTKSNARAAARQAAVKAGVASPLAGVHFDTTEAEDGRFTYILIDQKTGQKITADGAPVESKSFAEDPGAVFQEPDAPLPIRQEIERFLGQGAHAVTVDEVFNRLMASGDNFSECTQAELLAAIREAAEQVIPAPGPQFKDDAAAIMGRPTVKKAKAAKKAPPLPGPALGESRFSPLDDQPGKEAKARKAAADKPVGKKTLIADQVARGEIPAGPQFSDRTQQRYVDKLAEVRKAAEAGDLKGLRGIAIPPYTVKQSWSSIDAFRQLCVKALENRAVLAKAK